MPNSLRPGALLNPCADPTFKMIFTSSTDEYHIAHLLNHYTPKGTDWTEIPKVYQISVLNFIFDKKEKDAVNNYWVQNKHGRKVGGRMNFIFIEFPKIAKMSDNLKDFTKSEMWGKFFLYAPHKEKEILSTI